MNVQPMFKWIKYDFLAIALSSLPTRAPTQSSAYLSLYQAVLGERMDEAEI